MEPGHLEFVNLFLISMNPYPLIHNLNLVHEKLHQKSYINFFTQAFNSLSLCPLFTFCYEFKLDLLSNMRKCSNKYLKIIDIFNLDKKSSLQTKVCIEE